MNAVRDSYVEDNFQQVLNAFNDCGWETVLGDVSDENYTSSHRRYVRQRLRLLTWTIKVVARYYSC